jgi:hypothetical protein
MAAFGDFNEEASDHNYFGTDEPYVKHMSSTREFLWPRSPDVVYAEDLVEASSGFAFDADENGWSWPVMLAGCPRTIVAVFALRWNPMTGVLTTTIERNE